MQRLPRKLSLLLLPLITFCIILHYSFSTDILGPTDPTVLRKCAQQKDCPSTPPPHPQTPSALEFHFDATLDTMQLTTEEMSEARRLTSESVNVTRSSSFDPLPDHCPRRFIFVNTHTYGRHHNQLQEMMNIILWAEELNRTAVFGWFRANHRWIAFDALYNASEVSRRYCVTDAAHMQTLLPAPSSTVLCYGQCVQSTPLAPLLRQLRTQRAEGFAAHFGNKDAPAVMRRAIPRWRAAAATLLVLGGEYAFFLRAGLVPNAALHSLLQPAVRVRGMVDAFAIDCLGENGAFFGVHKRHRETYCGGEMDEAIGALRGRLTAQRERAARAQCNISVSYLNALHTSLGLQLFNTTLFLAHDGQDSTTVPQLVARGAKVYAKGQYERFKDCLGGLCALAVDYFLLRQGKYFAGNALSSISQNVCFARLGKGMACHGMQPELVRLFSRRAEESGEE